MATVVLTLSQPSQFESSQPLSQGHAAAPSSQAFASVAPISAVLALSAAPSPSRGRCLDSQRTRASASPANPADAAELQDENMHVSERQDEAAEEADAETDAEDSETLLETDEVMDKLRKMLRMRGRTLSNDLIRVMEAWLRELCAGDQDRQAQEASVATVEEFIRQSGVRSIDELNLVDECERQWWPEGEGLDPKKAAVLKLLAATKAKASTKDAEASKADTASKVDTANACETKTPGTLQQPATTPAGSPSKTQQELVAETPQPSLDADKSEGAPGKRAALLESPHVSPQRPTRSSGQAPVTTTAAAAADNEGEMDVDKEAQLQDTTGIRGAGPSSGDKRPREDESGGEGGCALPQDQDRALDAQVESHRRGAEQTYQIYHDLLAKRARLAREVDSAKQLEKTRREIAKKLDKDKAACAAREQELSEAEAALEEAQKRVFAAQHARRKQAASKLALEAEMKEVVHEQKGSNQRLKVLTEEFHGLLAKNNGSA